MNNTSIIVLISKVIHCFYSKHTQNRSPDITKQQTEGDVVARDWFTAPGT